MTDAANLLPTVIAAILGTVALLSTHLGKRALQTHQRAAHEHYSASDVTTEALVPGGQMLTPSAVAAYHEGGATTIPARGIVRNIKISKTGKATESARN